VIATVPSKVMSRVGFFQFFQLLLLLLSLSLGKATSALNIVFRRGGHRGRNGDPLLLLQLL
jgi:hypothetical protein